MKRFAKKLLGLVCAAALMCSMVSALPASATVGGGSAGSGKICAWGCDMSFYNVGGEYRNYSLVNFSEMKADGCEYVILRIGYEGTVSRANTLDLAFVDLYNMARAAGMGVGVYFYALGKTYSEAVEDAQWCIDIFEQYDMYFEYPIYYDVEDPGGNGRPSHESLSSAETTSLCLGWAQTLEAAGYFPGVYAGYYVLNDLQASYKNNYDTWIAAVTLNGTGTQFNPVVDRTSYQTTYGMWQYKWYNDTKTPSYNGSYWKDSDGNYPLDCNVSYKDYPTIIADGGYNNMVTKHTVSFETNGGSDVASVRVTDGEKLTKPASPTRYGFEFAGWYCDPELTAPYDFNTPVPYGFTLYAKWGEAYWGANTNLMPNSSQLQLASYNSAGEKIWPYWNNDAYSSVTLYNGVTEEWSWPSAYMTYENSFDTTHDSYIYVKKDGNALFNAAITYMANDGTLYTVKLSELAGKGDDDFAAGYMEEFFNLGQYAKNKGHIPASGNLKFTKVTYFVIGGPDSYVKLYDMKLTAKFDVAAPYTTLYDKNVEQIQGGGNYVYDDGVFTMESTSDEGYEVRFHPNVTFNPSEFEYLLADLTATAPYNMTLVVTTDQGDATVSVRNEFFDRFGLSNVPAALPAGTFKDWMGMYGFYVWNGGVPATSTVKSVTISVVGKGSLTIRGLQVSRNDTVAYVNDGEYASGSMNAGVPTAITSTVFTVKNDMIFDVKEGTNLAQLLAGLDQKGSVAVYDANGTKLSGVAALASGMTVKLENGGEVVKAYTLVLTGDVNGDGVATTVDARIVIGALLTADEPLSALNEWQRCAANFDGNGEVNTADVRTLLASVLV